MLAFISLIIFHAARAQEADELDIDTEFTMSDIQPASLMMRRPPPDLFNGTGEAMAQKVYEMAHLYQKHRSQGLTPDERHNLLGLRKLMQLKTMVVTLLASHQIDFDRFCFYGCYCLPDAGVHGKSPATGRPVDNIDSACHQLKMCYQCAHRDTKEETGETCDQLAAYSVTPIVEKGKIVDFKCTNKPDTCRWRICQCDRAFAHKIKDKHLNWKKTNHQIMGEFDRAICTPDLPAQGPQRECCGSYDHPQAEQQRQIIVENAQQCCNSSPYSDQVNSPIKQYGELC